MCCCHLPAAAYVWSSCKTDVLSAYAQFVQHVRAHHDRAEALYKRSLGSDPTHLDTLQYYAIFLEEVRGDLDAAEKLYSIALESTRNGLLDDIDPPTHWRPSTHRAPNLDLWRNTTFAIESLLTVLHTRQKGSMEALLMTNNGNASTTLPEGMRKILRG
jgi:tetratricopeptide (TPR) repeat protein